MMELHWELRKPQPLWKDCKQNQGKASIVSSTLLNPIFVAAMSLGENLDSMICGMLCPNERKIIFTVQILCLSVVTDLMTQAINVIALPSLPKYPIILWMAYI